MCLRKRHRKKRFIRWRFLSTILVTKFWPGYAKWNTSFKFIFNKNIFFFILPGRYYYFELSFTKFYLEIATGQQKISWFLFTLPFFFLNRSININHIIVHTLGHLKRPFRCYCIFKRICTQMIRIRRLKLTCQNLLCKITFYIVGVSVARAMERIKLDQPQDQGSITLSFG